MTIRSDSYWLTVPITPSIETVGDEKLNTVIPTRNDLASQFGGKIPRKGLFSQR